MMEQFVSMGIPMHLLNFGILCSVGHLECIFIALHGSLWLGKDKGSIMKSMESSGAIL